MGEIIDSACAMIPGSIALRWNREERLERTVLDALSANLSYVVPILLLNAGIEERNLCLATSAYSALIGTAIRQFLYRTP